jgi:Lar family restriction alleviation protein
MVTDMVTELKPCPFCGGEAYAPDRTTWLRCRECGCETNYFETLEEAIEAWNRRFP